MRAVLADAKHQHEHAANRFAVIPTRTRLDADSNYTGKGVTIAFLDSGFSYHPDLVEPTNRILTYIDLADADGTLDSNGAAEVWQWHGTQTSVVAAGNGRLSAGFYRGLACDARLVLVKASDQGRITEASIARGIKWIIENRERYDIRILNISLGGDQDVPCSLSIIDQAAEEAIDQGIVVIAAAGNSGAEAKHSIPPANSPSVITVGGYHDNNQLGRSRFELYQSNFGATADGSIKPEIIAPAMWVAAPILPGTALFEKAEALSRIAAAADYEISKRALELGAAADLPEALALMDPPLIRDFIESRLKQNKIVATHYQHVDGTSFAAPIVSSIVAQMVEANPQLTPGAIKNILLSTADRIVDAPAIRQGFGVVNARRAVTLAKTEQHALGTVGCGPPRIAGNSLQFLFHHDEALSVGIAGDFNGWDATLSPLTQDSTGLWHIAIEAPLPGRYQYKFLIDGKRWLEDPANGMKTPDNYGGFNSVLVVE